MICKPIKKKLDFTIPTVTWLEETGDSEESEISFNDIMRASYSFDEPVFTGRMINRLTDKLYPRCLKPNFCLPKIVRFTLSSLNDLNYQFL